MLLQVLSDTTASINQSSQSSTNTVLLWVGCGAVLLLLLYFLLKPKPSIKVEFKKSTSISQSIGEPKNELTNITPEVKKESEKKKTIEVPPSVKKYIGYNPVNVFTQSEPLNFPYVLMPNPGNVIMFPRKGRTGRKGYKEEDFEKHLNKYFRETHQLFDDRFILVKNNTNPYEPDFTLIDEKNGLNLFLDIEIDEPYEGINDIEKRKATHYQCSDTNRNNAFKSRGWIVIRFAEIQVHQEPTSCCRFVADVIKSINPGLKVPESLLSAKQVKGVKQWAKEEALAWSREKYREKYLGIERFGVVAGEERDEKVSQTEAEKQVEKEVKDEPIVITEIKNPLKQDSASEVILKTISERKFISFTHDNYNTVVRPIALNEDKLTAYCYVKNCQKEFNVSSMKNIQSKPSYYSLKVAAPTIGVESVKSAVKTAILYKKYVRMKYTRASWSTMDVDTETGEIIMKNVIEAEESTRTIDNIQMATDALSEEHLNQYRLNENYINAYCHKREEKRTFKFDRIGEIEVLDL